MSKKYNKEELSEIVKGSVSIAGCLRKLNIRAVGGNYKTIAKHIKRLNIDTSHFTGQGWSSGKRLGPSTRAAPLDAILVQNSLYGNSNLLKGKLIAANLKSRLCEQCKNTKWNDKDIPLELEHCNGDNTDNRIENLKLLCPNCHAQTAFYRGRNKLSKRNERNALNRVKLGESLTGNPEPSTSLQRSEGVETLRREPKSYICKCGNKMHASSAQCRNCDITSRKSSRPSFFQLVEDFTQLKSFTQVGRKYKVSDNAVRKWAKLYQIEDMVKRKSSAQTDIDLVVKTIV